MITVYQFHKHDYARVFPSFVFGCFSLTDVLESLKAFSGGHPDGQFIRVAEVDTNNLEEAFYLTNSINDSWGKNDGVRCLAERCRSTSSGDIMEMGGVLYVVMALGFLKDPLGLFTCPVEELPLLMGCDPYWDEIIERRLSDGKGL